MGVVTVTITSSVKFPAVGVFSLKQQKCNNRNILCIKKIFCFYFFNWRIIGLQCCVGFCHTTAQISHNYTHTHTHHHPFSLRPSSRLLFLDILHGCLFLSRQKKYMN